MRRSTSRMATDRGVNSLSRVTIQQVDDSKLMQEIVLNGYTGEQQETIEHAHPYGFTAVPRPPSQAAGGMSSTAASSSGSTQQNMKAAEAFVLFGNSNRSHAIAVVTGDRRFRLQNLKSGEVALHDDQTQQIHLARDGIYSSVPNGKKHITQVMQSGQTVSGQSGTGGSSANQSYGQQAWQPKTPAAFHSLDKTARTVQHPGQIVNNLVDAASRILHQTNMTKSGGITHSVQNGAHVLSLLNGIARTSSTKVTDKAPTIGHDGATSVTGTLGVTEAISGLAFNLTSDRRRKRKIKPAAYGLDAVMKLNVVEFAFDDAPNVRIQGLLAQQVGRHLPLAVVRGGRHAKTRPWRIDQGQLVAVLVKAIQDLQVEIERLKKASRRRG